MSSNRYKSKYDQQTAKDNEERQSAAIRKSIIRNVEVPIRTKNQENCTVRKRPSKQKQGTCNMNQQTTNSEIYHEPKLNKITELNKRLSDIKLYEASTLESVQDLTKNSQALVNREITAKLNFPPHQSIFKNLPTLDKKALTPIQKSEKQVAGKPAPRKSLQLREQINELINDLVEIEYKEKESDENIGRPKLNKFPCEDDYLGISKFSSSHFYVPNKRGSTQRYTQTVKEEISRELFKSEYYLHQTHEILKPLRETINNKADNNCKCLPDFYAEHSQCS